MNYIDIAGTINTLPKIIIIDGKTCCEFLLSSKASVKSNKIYEFFLIPVLLSRKNAKRCLAKFDKNLGRQVNVKGSISWNNNERRYNGFYIDVEKITGLIRS